MFIKNQLIMTDYYFLGMLKDHTILGLLSSISFHFQAQIGPFPALISKKTHQRLEECFK